MDPVALLNEIPDLIERCIKGYNFFNEVKDAPKACSELMKELDNTRAMLVELQEHFSGVEDKEKGRLSASLQNYKTALDKLDSVLKKYRDPQFKFTLGTSVKWAWSGKKEIKALCDDLKQNSGNFQPLLLQMARNIAEMNKRQQEADAKKAAKELAERLQNVVKWLEPLNSQAKLREVRGRRQPETCDWLPSHRLFVSWCESTGSFLWLNGIPGNGKTILASSVIDYLERNLKRAGESIVLFAFADFQDARSTDVVVLLRTLLAQLLDHCKPEDFVEDPDFTELEKTMQRHHADPPKFLQYLVELLGKASAPWKRVFIVIDALDECMQTGRRESMAAIRTLASAGSKISVFVTSRAEQDIVDVLSSDPTISLVHETQRVKKDIARFIEDKMNKSYLPLARFRESVRTRIASTLLEKANGMFRLVDCQLQSLAKAKLEKDIDHILENLPADLNSMYGRILDSVEGECQEAAQIVRRTLWWLVGSRRWLRLAELMEAVMVETGRDSPNTDLAPLSGEHLLEMCSSLVRYNAKMDILTLSHASVQDFLFSDYLKGTVHRDYHIPSFSFLHRHTTGLISVYLQYGDFQNGPCITPQNLAKRLEQHPFLVYVASNWPRHIVKMYETCSESGEQPPDIHTFFALSDNSEKSILARRSHRQVSHFGTELRYITKDGSSELQWKDNWNDMVHEDLLNVTESKYKLLEDISGFIHPCDCTGPSWLVNGGRLLDNYPWQDLSDTTSIEELDYMIYPLVSEGPASLVRDLLHKLPQFKERSLFYFGTPLMISIFAGKLDTVKMLLQDLHVDVDTCAWHYGCNYEVVSPIFLATMYGHIEAVKLLLQHGSATVFPLEPPPEWSERVREPEDGLSDIFIGAADYGRADILQTLIHHRVDKSTRSSISGNTVLHAAVRYGHIDSVKVLIEAGCDISPRSKGKTPLDLALNQRSSDIVRYLLDAGASFDQCLPQNFEDLKWAVGEPWYPETRQYLVTPGGGGPKLQQDIKKIARLLEKRLSSPPSHIIRAILDFAELWIVTSAERCEYIKFNWQPWPYEESYISTPPIAGGPETPVRRIVFMILSAEKGYGGHSRGLYSNSTTWFEAGVESSPGMFMQIQDNVSADRQSRTHVNVWDYHDAPSSIKEWMAKVKPGDKISVHPRTRNDDNYVESVKITVYTSCV